MFVNTSYKKAVLIPKNLPLVHKPLPNNTQLYFWLLYYCYKQYGSCQSERSYM